MKKIRDHLIALVVVCSIAWLTLFIIGHYYPLHPDAYRDITFSIVLVYAVGILLYVIYLLIGKWLSWEKPAVWWKSQKPFQLICAIFAAVTVVNSLMMLTGYDIPKQGTFAYIHMMIRLLIISVIIAVFMWRDITKQLRQINRSAIIHVFLPNIQSSLVSAAFTFFTFITLLYCLVVILFSRMSEPTGGVLFYQFLVGLFVFSFVYMFVLRLTRKSQ